MIKATTRKIGDNTTSAILDTVTSINRFHAGIGEPITSAASRALRCISALPRCRLLDVPHETRRCPSNDSIGRHIFRDHAAGADDRVISDRHAAHDHAPATNGCALAHQGLFHRPVRFSLQLPIGIGRSRITIVNENDRMADEYTILNRDPFADKCMARNLAVCPNDRSLLNFDKCADLRAVTDAGSTIEVCLRQVF